MVFQCAELGSIYILSSSFRSRYANLMIRVYFGLAPPNQSQYFDVVTLDSNFLGGLRISLAIQSVIGQCKVFQTHQLSSVNSSTWEFLPLLVLM